ncbi:SLC13 family permease [Dietzia maris]|uniref:SLC13 family permease n=1 Tax=Dietzia maris TaxID=37915 RepID=A0AAE4QZY6_9ACTN|nr:SLC13 family permease [Dietzia maris]MDV6299663.1 SLC13 family permease [Dietzia maris]
MTATVHHRTPGPGGSSPHARSTPRRGLRPSSFRPSTRALRAAVAALVLAAGVVALAVAGPDAGASAIPTLTVFATAVWFWVFTAVDDTFVALGAAVVLTVLGISDPDALFGSLGHDTMWLLIAAFIIAFAVSASGLATRAAVFVVTGARGPRSLVHLLTAALLATAFAVPATSGRAALSLPVFLALARVLADRPALVRMLALLFPTVILLSAVASLIGAGAHLITVQLLTTAGHEGLDFANWLILGLPLALVSSHLAAELVLLLFTTSEERGRGLQIGVSEFEAAGAGRVTGPLTVQQSRTVLLLAAMIVLWSTEALHGAPPALIALIGALVVTSPRYGGVELGDAVKKIPWALLLFMAATVTLGHALGTSGAADLLARVALGRVPDSGPVAGAVFVVAVVVVSALSHLVIQSRSARSAVLVPIVLSLAPGVGVSPVAAALLSTAAAGLCHTLPSSAKPVTIFAGVVDVPTFDRRDLLRLSAWLTPLMCVVFLAFAWWVWPVLGLPLFLS